MQEEFQDNFMALFQIHHGVSLVAMVNLRLKELSQFESIKLEARILIAMGQVHKLL